MILHGDCLDELRKMDENSIDAVVTDPPYELAFMGKGWDATGISYKIDLWREVLRVLKPGGHLLAFGGTRTYHRLVCAIEDSGFEIRDMVVWHYGSGFPKSLDVSKSIDRARDDFDARCKVALWLRPHVERVGFDKVTEHFGFADETMARARWTTASQPQTPTMEQWAQLKGLCGFGDEMDSEIERLNRRKGTPGEAWGKREFIGKAKWKTLNEAPLPGADCSAENRSHKDVTAPATEDAHRWQGWGTALKPATEPICLARKPLSEKTVAANIQRWSTGALNIDASRIEAGDSQLAEKYASIRNAPVRDNRVYGKDKRARSEGRLEPHVGGRWPSNLILDEEAARMLDEQSGEQPSRFFAQFSLDENERAAYALSTEEASCGNGNSEATSKSGGESREVGRSFRVRSTVSSGKKRTAQSQRDTSSTTGTGIERTTDSRTLNVSPVGTIRHDIQTGSASGTGSESASVEPARSGSPSPTIGNSEDGRAGSIIARNARPRSSARGERQTENTTTPTCGSTDAARFRYVAKPSKWEKEQGIEGKMDHPTVKPIALMRYLIRLVTPPGGRILDPFLGSGTTLCAVHTLNAEGHSFQGIGIEREAEYVEIARARVSWYEKYPEEWRFHENGNPDNVAPGQMRLLG